jgi:hypothetical protein
MADKIDTEGSMRVTGGISDNLNYFQPVTGVTFQQIKPLSMLSLGPCGITIDLETGEVTLPAGMTLTEGAQAFWDAVQHVSGYRRPGFW